MNVKVHVKKKTSSSTKNINNKKEGDALTISGRKSDDAKYENMGTKTSKVGLWKAVGLIIINREPKTGQTTAYLLAEVLAYVFNAFAVVGAVTLLICLKASIFDLDWSGNCQKNMIQGVVAAILLAGIGAISLIFRAMANDVKAEKDRNYIANLFFGFAGFASLIVALITFLKE